MAKFSGIVFIECETDKILVLKLVDRRCIRCAGGIGEVCNKLKVSESSCGVVDEDPTKTRPKYMIDLLRSSVISNSHDIIVAHDRARNNYLIALCPDRESWLINTAKVLGIDLKVMGLSNDPKEFKRINLRDPKKIEPFIDEMLKRYHPRVNELKNA